MLQCNSLLICDIVCEKKLGAGEIPDLLVVSDMQFNEAVGYSSWKLAQNNIAQLCIRYCSNKQQRQEYIQRPQPRVARAPPRPAADYLLERARGHGGLSLPGRG